MAARKKARFEFVHNQLQRAVTTLDENWPGWTVLPRTADGVMHGLFKLRPPKGSWDVDHVKDWLIEHGAAVVLVEAAREDAAVAALQPKAAPAGPGDVVRRLVELYHRHDKDKLRQAVEGHLARVKL